MPRNERINVTKTFLPPIEEYEKYLKQIWQRDWLTNQGPLLQELESKLKEYLGAKNLHLVTNGTIALQLALRALDITEGEVITTPFTYVATISSILWERCRPVFVDIDPKTFCIDAKKIEAAISPETRGIMPVHVFGYPCDITTIATIAKKHNLKVIYDAAHAFGVQYQGKSLMDYGDIAIGSFHATKLFHTVEGGCLIVKDKAVSETVELMKRFGHNNDDHYQLGINAKLSEVHAAMGLCNLRYIDKIIEKRKQVTELYDELLGAQRSFPAEFTYNYNYYPYIFKSEQELLAVCEKLNQQNIFPRRYFFPSLNTLSYLETDMKRSCPISEDVARRIVCLPLHDRLGKATVKKICEIIKE